MENSLPYTLIIPTFNRHELLSSLLKYLSTSELGFKILVLDSSGAAIAAKNKQLCADLALDLDYRAYPETTLPGDKWLDGLNAVTTEFVSFCADDDFVFVESISDCVAFLASHPDYSVCHASYINFKSSNDFYIEYYMPSLDGDSVIRRIWQLMKNYEAVTYGIFRTSVYRKILEKSNGSKFELMYQELLMGILPLVYGKIKRLSGFYYARNGICVEADTQRKKWHPLLYAMDDSEELFVEYGRYRKVILECMEEAGIKVDPRDFIHNFNLIHLHYLVYSTDNQQILGAINQNLGLQSQGGASSPVAPAGAENRIDPIYLKRAGLELQIYYHNLLL